MDVDIFTLGKDKRAGEAEPALVEQREELVLATSSAVEAIERADIDTQIATAKRFPRDIDVSVARAKDLACRNRLLASSCTYAIKRAQKNIIGGSVRLAEVMAPAWGNLRYGGRLVDIGERFIIAQGICQDTETNSTVALHVIRSIIDGNGQRYNEDMIRVTAQAAIMIGLRNAIFTIIPKAYVEEVRLAAQKVARGEEEGLEVRLQKALTYFEQFGISKEQVFTTLEVSGSKEVTWIHIDLLGAYAISIETGEVSDAKSLFVTAEPEPDGDTTFGRRKEAPPAQGGEGGKPPAGGEGRDKTSPPPAGEARKAPASPAEEEETTSASSDKATPGPELDF